VAPGFIFVVFCRCDDDEASSSCRRRLFCTDASGDRRSIRFFVDLDYNNVSVLRPLPVVCFVALDSPCVALRVAQEERVVCQVSRKRELED